MNHTRFLSPLFLVLFSFGFAGETHARHITRKPAGAELTSTPSPAVPTPERVRQRQKTADSLARLATPAWLLPDSVSARRLPARTGIIPYATRDEALLRPVETASTYFAPLSDWTVEPCDEGTRFTTRFKVPFAWVGRRTILHVGASDSFTVSVNGRRAGYSQHGAGGEFDLTPFVREGADTLAVVVHRATAASRLKAEASGTPSLEGPVYLISQPPMRIVDIAVDARTEHGAGLFNLGVAMQSHLLNPKTYELFYELLAPDGSTVGEGRKTISLRMHGQDTVRFFARIPDIRPWNPETPYLYTLVLRTVHEGRTMEQTARKIGFRAIATDDEGRFTIDGVPVRLQAARLVPERDSARLRTRLAELRATGYNCVLVSGPQPEYFWQLCDSIGLLAAPSSGIDTRREPTEITRGGNPGNDPLWATAYLDRIETLAGTAGSHPSAALFVLADQAGNGYCLYEAYLRLKTLAGGRPVIYPDAAGQWNDDGLRPELPDDPVEEIVTRAGDLSRGEAIVENRRKLTPLEGTLYYTIYSGRRRVARGEVAVRVDPDSRETVTLPIGRAMEKANLRADLRIEIPAAVYDYRHTPAPEPEPKRVVKLKKRDNPSGR